MSSDEHFIVGLTGGIGSGKSAAAEAFATLGIVIVDTDAIAHELTAAGGEAMPGIVAQFGTSMQRPDGALDRDAMRRKVFADPDARLQLEALLHPLIRRDSAIRCAQADSPYVILAVPLLIESGDYRKRCNRICVVDCAPEVQLARVIQRSGLTPAQVEAIMAAQIGRAERLAAADDVIDNSGTLAELHARVRGLDRLYHQLAGRSGNTD